MTEPIGVYGETKLAGEKAIVASGCNYIILRTAWLYSVWGNNFLKTMLKLTKERESLNVVFDQIGTPTYAGDLADAIGWIIDHRMIEKKIFIISLTKVYALGMTLPWLLVSWVKICVISVLSTLMNILAK